MPNATISSTASTFGTISGTFAADQSTITGTITGIVAGTLDGSVGVPGPRGEVGPQGPQGEKGDAATVDVGTTTTGEPLTNASVVNVGTTSAAIFDFTIPAGAVGPQGDKGDKGDTGDRGPQGPVSVSVGTTYTGDAGTSASVTNVGTYEDLVLDFTIPKGDKGDQGDPGPAFTGGEVANPITMHDGTSDSEMAASFFGVELSGDTSQYSVLSYNGLTVASGTSSVVVSPNGIMFPGATSEQTTPWFDAPSDGVNYVRQNAAWNNADSLYYASSNPSGYLNQTAADSLYYAIGNPSGFLTDAPSDGTIYGRQNGSWVTASTFDGGTVHNAISVTDGTYTTVYTYQGVYGVGQYGSSVSLNNSDLAELVLNNYGTSTLTVTGGGITFPDTSYQSTAFTGWANAPVTSVAGRTGAVTLAVADVSGAAPLASPVFTGDARAVTPSFGDNDTSIATTAFVQSALAGGTAIARNLEFQVRNQSGASIPAGSIVFVSGATGNLPLITLAQANNDANSAQTIGFVKTTIANNGTGYVISRGILENIDTSALTEGNQLYLSPTTAGTWTTTKPYAPSHLVYVGIVIRSHPTQGTILVAVQNGYELDELHNVAAQTPSNNDLLAYESSTSLWKNKTFSALGLLTSATAASTYYLQSNPAGYLTSSTAGALYYPLSSNPAGYLTSAPVTSVAGRTGAITLAVADVSGAAPLASPTFTGTVTIPAGASISGYATTASLSSYAPLASPTFTGTVTIPAGASISGYATTASLSSYAPLASPTFTGTVTIPAGASISGYLTTATASSTYLAKASNLSDVANAATARTNLGLGTAATLASTAVAQTANNLSDLASVSTARTNLGLTAPATSAFATSTETRDGTSTSVVVNPNALRDALMSSGLRFIPTVSGNSAVSGTGATVTAFSGGVWGKIVGPNASTAGYGVYRLVDNANSYQYFAFSRGQSAWVVDYSKPWIVSFRMVIVNPTSGATVRFKIGQPNTDTGGDLTAIGFGLRIVGTGVAELQKFWASTLSNQSSSFTPTSNTTFDVVLFSNNGTVQMYINDTLQATLTSGPTGTQNAVNNMQYEVVTTGTQTLVTTVSVSNLKVFNGI